MPTHYLTVLLIISIILHLIIPIKKILYPSITYIGFLFIVIGIIMNLWTDRLFNQKKTTVKPHLNPTVLITSGPFQLSRHPMYLGMLCLLLGVAFTLGTVSTFIPPMIFFIVMKMRFIPIEERNLTKVFGDEYLSYKQKVRQWV